MMGQKTVNEILAENLSRLMDERGIKQLGLAKQSGVAQTTVSLYLNPERRQPGKTGKIPSAKLTEVEKLAQVFDIPVWELLQPALPKPRALQQIVTDAVDAANQEEYVPVRRASVKIVGGDPVITVDPAGGDFNGVINLSKTWLQKRGLKAESVFVATVAGDSMQPRIHEGDLLLLNQADTTKRDGRVYGFVHDGRFVVKRLRKDGRRWLLTSDNPEYAPIEAIEATKVVGRVVLMQGEGV